MLTSRPPRPPTRSPQSKEAVAVAGALGRCLVELKLEREGRGWGARRLALLDSKKQRRRRGAPSHCRVELNVGRGCGARYRFAKWEFAGVGEGEDREERF